MTIESDIARLRGLTGIKWTRYDEDVLAAWVADMDFATAPAIRQALREMVDEGDTGYGFDAHRQIPDAWCAWTEQRHGWLPSPDRVRLFGGVLQPLAAVLHVHTMPGDGVVLFTPVYPPFFGMIERAGRRVIDCPLDAANGWRIDPERLAASIDESTTAVILCNPHNPIGRVFDAEELAAVARIAEERDLLVISDEIWCDIVHPDSTHIPFAALPGPASARAVTLAAASKSFNLGGLNCAVAHFGDAEVLQAVDSLPPHLLGHANTLGARATLAGWTQGAEWLDSTLRILWANRDRLAARLSAELPAVGFDAPQATYLAWLDFRGTRVQGDPAEFLLEHARVALSAGPDFGCHVERFARLNFATTPDILDRIVDRIVQALE